MPTISFITCVYNASRWLEQCLSSIAAQDDKDFEAIIVNDGSTDDSQLIIDRFADRFPCFKSFVQPNRGTAAATNFAVSKCSGKYVVNVDNDDWVEPDLVSFLKKIITAHSPDVISFMGVDNFGNQFPDKKLWPNPKKGLLLGRQEIKQAIEAGEINYFTHTTQAVSRQLMLMFPFMPPATGADGATMTMVYSCAQSCYVSDRVLYHYLLRNNSQSHIHPLDEALLSLARYIIVLKKISVITNRSDWPLPQLKELPALLESAHIEFINCRSKKWREVLKDARRSFWKYRKLLFFPKGEVRLRFKTYLWVFVPALMLIRSRILINKQSAA